MSINTVHVMYPKIPDCLRLYRAELRVLERNQEKPLLRDLVGAFATEVVEMMEYSLAQSDRLDREIGIEHCAIGIPNLEAFTNMVRSIGDLLKDRDREAKYWSRLVIESALQGNTPDMRGRQVLESIDDDVADFVRKFRRASGHSKRRPTYPKTIESLKAIQRAVAYGWSR